MRYSSPIYFGKHSLNSYWFTSHHIIIVGLLMCFFLLGSCGFSEGKDSLDRGDKNEPVENRLEDISTESKFQYLPWKKIKPGRYIFRSHGYGLRLYHHFKKESGSRNVLFNVNLGSSHIFLPDVFTVNPYLFLNSITNECILVFEESYNDEVCSYHIFYENTGHFRKVKTLTVLPVEKNIPVHEFIEFVNVNGVIKINMLQETYIDYSWGKVLQRDTFEDNILIKINAYQTGLQNVVWLEFPEHLYENLKVKSEVPWRRIVKLEDRKIFIELSQNNSQYYALDEILHINDSYIFTLKDVEWYFRFTWIDYAMGIGRWDYVEDNKINPRYSFYAKEKYLFDL